MAQAERRQDYLDLAAALRRDLEAIDGFISVERFESLTEPGKLLSLSFWRDEAAVAAWRNLATHRAAQTKGRGGIFADYRLRIAGVHPRLRHDRPRRRAGRQPQGPRLGSDPGTGTGAVRSGFPILHNEQRSRNAPLQPQGGNFG